MQLRCPFWGIQQGLELDDGFTFPALDGHQVPQDPRFPDPARTADLADDPLGDGLHLDLPLHYPAALAKMLDPQLRKRRPGDVGQHLPVVWAAAFVHQQ